MSVFNNIQNALNTRLNTVTGLPEIAWPNLDYTPAQNTNFVRPTLLPANSTLYTLDDVNMHRGIYQISIFTKLKKGTSELLLIADAIRDNFKAVKSITSGGDVVHIQEISISQAERTESWWSCYVQINYICFN